MQCSMFHISTICVIFNAIIITFYSLSYNDLGVQSVEVLGSVLAKLPNLKSLVW